MIFITEIGSNFLNRKLVGFKFTMETWMLLSDYTQLPPIDFGLMKPESFIVKTCYCATKLWHLEQGKRVKFTEDDVKGWIEEMSTKDSAELVNTLFKSRIGGESLEELIPKAMNEIKKKSHSII